MKKDLVTVVIPTYKRQWKYVSRAIESVLSQTYKNIEIIVVDDSPDSYSSRNDVKKHMLQYIEKNKNIVYLMNEENIGGSLSRNKGINIANGEYITFLDDDDEYLPDKIKNQIEFMKNTNCDLSFEDMKMYNEKDEIVDYRTHNDIKSFDNKYLLKYHLKYHMTGTPTFMFKTSALKKIGGFDDAKMGQEFYLMFKSIKNNLSIRYFPICDVKIYKHSEGGISQGNNKIVGENQLYEFKKKYWRVLSFRDKLFVRFRHYIVMMIAYKRNKNYIKVIISLIKAFLFSPVDFIGQGMKFALKIEEEKKCRNYMKKS